MKKSKKKNTRLAKTDTKLNPRHKLFVYEHIKTGFISATAAYQKIYGTKSEKMAGISASRLLRNVRVHEFMKNELKAIFDNERDIVRHKVWKEWQRIAHSDITKIKMSDPNSTAAIQSIEYNDVGKIKRIKTHPKHPALKALGIITGLQEEGTNININTGNQLIAILPPIDERPPKPKEKVVDGKVVKDKKP